jgi:hypothetical protein
VSCPAETGALHVKDTVFRNWLGGVFEVNKPFLADEVPLIST